MTSSLRPRTAASRSGLKQLISPSNPSGYAIANRQHRPERSDLAARSPDIDEAISNTGQLGRIGDGEAEVVEPAPFEHRRTEPVLRRVVTRHLEHVQHRVAGKHDGMTAMMVTRAEYECRVGPHLWKCALTDAGSRSERRFSPLRPVCRLPSTSRVDLPSHARASCTTRSRRRFRSLCLCPSLQTSVDAKLAENHKNCERDESKK